MTRIGLLIICLVGLCFVGFFATEYLRIKNAVQRFTFSVPVRVPDLKLTANLPPGMYVIVITTNIDGRAFGVVPPERQYAGELVLTVRIENTLLLRKTNAHYEVFRVNKDAVGEVSISLQRDKAAKGMDENLYLHLGRGY